MRGAAPKSASTALSYPITAGRQFDRALTAVQALPAIKRAVGDRLVIMLDGGIRRGSDIVTSLPRRPFRLHLAGHGTIAGGDAGVRRALAILRDELDRTLGQIACPDVAELGDQFICHEP